MGEILKTALFQSVPDTVQGAAVDRENSLGRRCRIHDGIHLPTYTGEAEHLRDTVSRHLPGYMIRDLSDVGRTGTRKGQCRRCGTLTSVTIRHEITPSRLLKHSRFSCSTRILRRRVQDHASPATEK